MAAINKLVTARYTACVLRDRSVRGGDDDAGGSNISSIPKLVPVEFTGPLAGVKARGTALLVQLRHFRRTSCDVP